MDLGFQGTIDYGGHGRVTIELTRALARLCDRITVYPTVVSVDRPTSHKWWVDMPDNVVVAEKRGLLGSYARDAMAFPSHDVLHLNYGALGWPAIATKHLADVPYVYTAHGIGKARELVSGAWSQAKWWADLQVFLPAVARFGEFATISESNRETLLDEHGLDASVVPHGIRRERIPTEAPGDLRERYDIDPDVDILLFVGRFHKYKDVSTLLRGYAILREEYDGETELVVIGGGGSVRDVPERIRSLGLSDAITHIQDADDSVLGSFYAESTLFAFPSYGECFGLVFLEAMAARLPTAYVDAGAAPEVVGDAGVAAEPRDPRSFADAMLELLEDEERYEEVKRRCASRVAEFTWERAAEEYVELYRTAIDG